MTEGQMFIGCRGLREIKRNLIDMIHGLECLLDHVEGMVSDEENKETQDR